MGDKMIEHNITCNLNTNRLIYYHQHCEQNKNKKLNHLDDVNADVVGVASQVTV